MFGIFIIGEQEPRIPDPPRNLIGHVMPGEIGSDEQLFPFIFSAVREDPFVVMVIFNSSAVDSGFLLLSYLQKLLIEPVNASV